jgi:hypothetical protein
LLAHPSDRMLKMNRAHYQVLTMGAAGQEPERFKKTD